MDGNGRWARAQGQPRLFGHREGANAVRRAVEAARREGIEVLTLFAFSGDNWKRPEEEVRGLMNLFRSFLLQEMVCCAESGVRLTVIGRRDRLAPTLLKAVDEAEAFTADGDGMLLRIAVDYSSRDAILSAARAWRQFDCGESGGGPRLDGAGAENNMRESFSLLMQAAMHSAIPAPDVDLLIRTGGELRLSDFMLWECAYAELVFTQKMWPEFAAEDLQSALGEFRSRQRRFGALPEAREAILN
jgi:undecaprenyl diphosphate synthase